MDQLNIIVLTALLGLSQADKIGPPSFAPTQGSEKPFGPEYCQARCIASCLETFLATTVEECGKFCPPFQNDLPCPADDAKCWAVCGVRHLSNETAPPESPSLTPQMRQNNDQMEQNPFVIEMAWNAVPNASLYVVEFYPHNRTPKPGESNFFQVMTTSLAYTVRKEDECVEYSGRVIAVNSYGISMPAYAFIGAPVPTMRPFDHFSVRNMQRDPWSSDLITVTIDYSFPTGWPTDDISIDSIRVVATDCKGPLGNLSFDVAAASESAILNPSYNAIIGKSPTTAIQLSFFEDVLKSNCMFQMRIASLTTRCNTSVTFDQNVPLAPGIDFRINCDSVNGACDNETAVAVAVQPPPPAPIPIPPTISVDPKVVVPPLTINTPGHIPPGIEKPDDYNTSAPDSIQDMPTPPSLPLFIIDQTRNGPNIPQPPATGPLVSVVDVAPNGTSVEAVPIMPQSMIPPMCELDMLDVEPSHSQFASSLVDLKALWLEHQPLPPLPTPTYFAIRYGPMVRKLVDDDRLPNEIIPGYETIVRTGRQQQIGMPPTPDPTREITITDLQRGTLLKIQICAIYDPNSEPLIQWESVHSRHIDLAALEPFLELEAEAGPPQYPDISSLLDIHNAAAAAADLSPVSPVLSPLDPLEEPDSTDTGDSVPMLIAVNVQPTTSSTTYWLTVTAGGLLILLTFLLVLLFLRRLCASRKQIKKKQSNDKAMYIVSTVPVSIPQPTIKEEVKVPMP